MPSSHRYILAICYCLVGLALPTAGADDPDAANLLLSVKHPVDDASSYPDEITRMGEHFYFFADDGHHGTELWVSDGSACGTRMVKDIAPGPELGHSWGRKTILAGSERLWMLRDDGVHGKELWTSDGTSNGTHLVADLCPGRCYWDFQSPPFPRLPWQGSLFFIYESKLWFSNGTSAGTAMIEGPEDLGELAALADKVVFSASGKDGKGLWTSDGTTAGTSMYFTLCTDDCPSVRLTEHDGRLYFRQRSNELWSTDGTAAGTTLITALDSSLGVLCSTDSTLYLIVSHEPGQRALWKSDGTSTGTVLVDTLPAGKGISSYQTIGPLLLFFTYDKETNERILWRSDGTEAGTLPLLEGDPGLEFLSKDIGGRIILRTGGYYDVDALWVTDGTVAGTYEYFDFEDYDDPIDLLARDCSDSGIDGKQLFQARSPYGSSDNELWTTDGTAAGTYQLKEINRPMARNEPMALNTLGEHLVFFLQSQVTWWRKQTNLWRSDGTREGTAPISVAQSLRSEKQVEIWNGKLYFPGYDSTGRSGIWVSDGTAEGTCMVDEMPTPTEMTAAGSHLFLAAYHGLGQRLWRSNGAPNTTVLIKDFWPDWRASICGGQGCKPYPQELVAVGDTLFFLAYGDPGYEHLWRIRGREAPVPIEPDWSGYYKWLVSTDDALYIKLSDELHRCGPDDWRTTQVWSDWSRRLWGTAALGNQLFFLTVGQGLPSQLRRVDGEGSVLISNLQLEQAHGYASWLTAVGDLLFLCVTNQLTGPELWVSDGTTEGTHLVTEIVPGPAGSYPSSLTAAGDLLLFAADDGVAGLELWASDGTASGTVQIDDIAPGLTASSPNGMTLAGDTIYFRANDGGDTRQLWAVPLQKVIDKVEGKLLRDSFESGNTSAWALTISGI